MKTLIFSLALFALAVVASAIEPGDVILNEVYFYTKGEETNHYEAVELLVVSDKVNLNNIQITDRDVWYKETEDQCTLNDLGQGFLKSVPSGTLIVIYDGKGEDDIDASDFVLKFYVQSSLFCNATPTGHGFILNDHGDNLHLITQDGRQLDFMKYKPSDAPNPNGGEPGGMSWERGVKGFVDVAPFRQTTGCRFVGDSAELNDYIASWRVYSETYFEDNNLGKPNGGRNTEWINVLRAKASSNQSTASTTPSAPEVK